MFDQITTSSFNVKTLLLVIAFSILTGFIVGITYIFSSRKTGYSQSLLITLIMLPPIIAIIILLVGNSITGAISLAGAFALVRYRSEPREPKDIAYVFLTLAGGLACGLGFVGYGVLFVLVLSVLVLILNLLNFGRNKNIEMTLKIQVPEEINFQGTFNEILDAYTIKWSVKKVKTADFGAIFIIEYLIVIKPDCDQKKMIDEIRCRNGNLNISLVDRMYEE